ncbi:MAG TPA: cupredoxin domain-containing protein [Stellaceae bacterium]|nr:cupredoxin domain-containing protein [Stellaceae bacterium]
MRRRLPGLTVLFVIAFCGLSFARAEEGRTYTLTIKDHRFTPTEIEIPAGKKISLTVKNLDSTPEEFESTELHREKVVTGGQEVTVYIGPLQPGRYEFFGDFNPQTARGHIVVK